MKPLYFVFQGNLGFGNLTQKKKLEEEWVLYFGGSPKLNDLYAYSEDEFNMQLFGHNICSHVIAKSQNIFDFW